MRSLRTSLVALLLLSASLIACNGDGGTEKPAVTTDAPVVSGSESVTEQVGDLVPSIPENLTFEGNTFTILSGTYNDFCFIGSEASDGEVVNDARRTMMNNTAERFNIEVKEASVGVFDLNMTLNTLVSSGDTTYSIVNHLDRFAISAMTAGYLRPFDDLKYVDLSTPWWNPDITGQLLVGDTHYLASSAASVMMYADTMVMWINTTLATAYDIDVSEIYDAVRNGTWTMDQMMEYASLVTGEVNGDNTMDGNDRYGFFPLDTNLTGTTLITAGGMQSISREGERFSVNWADERYLELAENAYEIMHSDDTFLSDTRAVADMFTESRALFMSDLFHRGANKVANMKDDYTCVPIPKYSADQEKYTCANYDIMFFCVPKFVDDMEFTGAVVDWLSYEGLTNVKDAYIESTMKNKKSLTPEMREMIGLCLDSSMIDLGSIMASDVLSYDSLWASVFSLPSFQYSSYVAKQQANLEGQLAKIVEAVEDNKD